jgi:hypothetical protein
MEVNGLRKMLEKKEDLLPLRGFREDMDRLSSISSVDVDVFWGSVMFTNVLSLEKPVPLSN